MNRFFLFFVSVMISASSFGKNKIENVWPKNLPSDVTLDEGEMVEAMGEDNILRVFSMSRPTLEKFEVNNSSKDKVVIVCPGGGYEVLADNLEGTEIAEWLNGQGYTAYVLRYRVPKMREGDLQDAQRAIRIVRSENPGKKIGIMGFSAGGSLSARAGTRFDTPSYMAVDEIDKQSARPDFVGLIYPAYLDLGENNSLTPELTISENTPPMFLFQTADDDYCNSSLVMTKALRDHKIPAELHVFSKGGHGYGLRPDRAAVGPVWPELMGKWLNSLKLK